jgi:hypothetical protein
VREMSTENPETVKPIKDVKNGTDRETVIPRKRDQVFLKGADRKRRRRLDLRTLNGTLRESARVYRELAEGKISLEHAEVRSRVLGRHRDILAALKQSEQLEAIQQQLAELRTSPGMPIRSADVPQLAASHSEEDTK